jgi:hypothetical protein
MRRVIKGKLYDTDKAKRVHEWESTYDVTDFKWYEETLYRKRTGEYFIYGYGGPMTSYAKRLNDSQWQGGEAIVPLTYEEARTWMEEHASTDEYEAEFGTADEGDGHDLHVIISETAWQAISRAATREGTTMRAIIERLASTL